MLNFFGTNQVVPNGYIYTSGTGSKYICLEGIWFNNETLKLVDPSKTERMDSAATQQITEHNKNARTMIGESFNFAGKAYVYLGENRFSEDGIITESSIISEVIADEQRTYQVSRDTLNREWNQIGFYIMPPHSEDIVIPAGFELSGYKFIPKVQRFIDMTTGKAPSPSLERKLWAEANRMVSIINNREDSKIFPIKSVLVQRNSNVRSEWNGKEFVDNEGNVIVPASKIPAYRKAYQEFINANPKDFPTLAPSTQTNSERTVPHNKYAVPTKQEPSMKESIMEAGDDSEFSNFVKGDTTNIEVPNNFKLDSFYYNKKKNAWYDQSGQVTDSTFNQELSADAIKKIKHYNDYDEFPINSTIDYRGKTLTWNGIGWDTGEGKTYNSSAFTSKVDEYLEENPPKDEPASEPSPSPETSSGAGEEVPTGYQIKSKSGKTYVKKGQAWIDVSTKKPLNSSASQSVERAAQTAIVNHNKTADVKIGQEFKAKSGTVYKYVGGTGFVSKDGKRLAPTVAQGILDRMQKDTNPRSSDTQNEPENSPAPTNEPEVVPTNEPEVTPEVEPSSEPSRETGPLDSLAERIKASPLAKKIRVLLTRGDAISLLAADIMLSGKREDALQILKSLNNNDE